MSKNLSAKYKAAIVVNAISIVCALVVMGAVLLWAPPCTGMLELANGNMVPMRCAYTAETAILLSVVLIATCCASLVLKRPFTVAAVAVSIAIAALVVDTPLTIGICKSSDMACWNTAVWLIGAGLVSALAALVGFVVNPDRKRA